MTVSLTRRSLKSRNEYFYIEIQNSPTEKKAIRVIVSKEYQCTNHTFYLGKNKAKALVKVKNISKTLSGTNFLNTTSAVECAFPKEC